MICDKYNFYRAPCKIVFAKFIIEDAEHVCTRHNTYSLWSVNTELTLNLLTCTKGVFRPACAFNQYTVSNMLTIIVYHKMNKICAIQIIHAYNFKCK